MSTPALELIDITKRYGPITANGAVNLRVASHSVHALVGENGAGKSTLMRIAYGMVQPDEGQVCIKGERIAQHSVATSIAHGVGMVHQHFMLVGPLTVAENVVLGREPAGAGMRRPFMDLHRATREIAELSQRFGLDVDPTARIEELSVGEQQRVEIVKVLWRGCDVLILDEPTAVLTPGEVRDLFAVLRTLVREGMTVVMITHKLDEVLAIADQVTVMRRGEVVAELSGEGLSADDIARAMVGRPVLMRVERPPAEPGEVVAEISDLEVMGYRGAMAVQGVSLEVRAGEILGIAGVEGNGQSELIEAIMGLRPVTSGHLRVAGKDVTRVSVRARYDAGLAHVPEDRHSRALVLDYTIRENLVLGQQHEFAGSLGMLDQERMTKHAQRLIEEFDIRPPEPAQISRAMSGGNQQKVVVARELTRRAPKLLVAAQPTRGVDIGAIEAIHRRIIEARTQGLAVLLLSAELSELKALSDRLAVMYKGRIVAVLEGSELAAEDALERVGALMTGATKAGALTGAAKAAASGAPPAEVEQ